MGPIRVTLGRTVGRARSLYSTAFAVGGFLATAALLLSRLLESAEGGALHLPALMTLAAAPVLPIFAALLGMDVWSDEKQSGRMDALMTIAVREREFVLGKFAGVFLLLTLTVLAYVVTAVFFVNLFAPSALTDVSLVSVVFALSSLEIQGLLWSAVAVATSAFFSHAAAAAAAACLLTVVLPRAVWYGLLAWSSGGGTPYGEFPLDAHAVDMTTGLLPAGTVATYLILTGVALFIATKCVSLYRLNGCGASGLRWSSSFAILLALVFAVLSTIFFVRVNPVADLAVVQSGVELSSRTRSILADTSGTIAITAFIPRNDTSVRAVGRVMRELKRQSDSVGGAKIELRFVDPRWDIGEAERLVRRGIPENSLVFEKGRHIVSLPVKDGCGERVCASTIRRITHPPHRQNVYWTVGHGESRFDDYGAFGMSDIARDLFREGFHNQTIDLSTCQSIPGDCALILVAGARDDFSRAEIDRLSGYLRDGGRMLVLLGSAKSGGIVSLLPSWGMRPVDRPPTGGKTISGTDVIVTGLTDHPISSSLRGSRIVLERPVSILPSAVAGTGTDADSIGYSSVAEVNAATVVAAVERGRGAGDDLALRPTRVVVLGDAGFVLNGQLAVRACANRDFFLNCVSYLSGSEVLGSGEEDADRFRTELDRSGRFRHGLLSSVAFPGFVFLVLVVMAAQRRRKP